MQENRGNVYNSVILIQVVTSFLSIPPYIQNINGVENSFSLKIFCNFLPSVEKQVYDIFEPDAACFEDALPSWRNGT